MYAGSHPYETISFQWSNHIEHADGTLLHEDYLHHDGTDPRETFTQTLMKSLGREGSICVYTAYEQGVLTALADRLPQFRREILAVIERLWDLHAVVKANYYHPDFWGSFSLKSVLPALVPELAYADLEIQDGSTASVQYARMISESTVANERASIRKALLKYCERDTLAMLEVRKALGRKAGC